MPGYLLGYPIAGATAHFTVTYAAEGDVDALGRAQAILNLCEYDLSLLERWFNCNFDNSRYAIWVHVDAGVPGGGASNYGYEGTSESSRIVVSGTYLPSPKIRDDFACMLFVAELAEILMDFTGYGWARGNSAGEALSQCAAAELHTAAYYTAGAGNGPRTNQWLQSNSRPDWVSNSAGNDTDIIAYGCGVVFLNYLVYQLGYPFSEVVRAGGGSLAETYARLTGQPASTAFDRMRALLEQHIPLGERFPFPRNNVFPLLDRPWVSFHLDGQRSADPQPGTYTIALQAGPKCPVKDYTYTIENITFELDVEAKAHGVAYASFDWKLNGVPLPQHGLKTNAMVSVTIADITPGEDVPFMYSLPVWYRIDDSLNTSRLSFGNNGAFPGNCEDLQITVTVTEGLQYNFPAVVQSIDSWLTMRSYDMDSAWVADVWKCHSHPVLEMASSVAALSDAVFVLLHTPDPAPDQVLAIEALAKRYAAGLKVATAGSIGLRAAVAAVARLGRLATASPPAVERPGVAGGLSTRVRGDAAPGSDRPAAER